MRFGTIMAISAISAFALCACSGKDVELITIGSGGQVDAGDALASDASEPANDAGGTPDGTVSGDGALDADGETLPPNRCPSAHGPRMAELPNPSGGTFCVDTTEVTNAQYAEFIAATNGSTMSACDGNIPGARSVPTAACGYDPVTKPSYPVACVAWCDADAYCTWSGKRLCGHFGGAGNPLAQFDKSDSSEWYSACSSNGTNSFVYGDATVFGRCNDAAKDPNKSHPYPVDGDPECHPTVDPYTPILDMNGNLAEWENSCDDTTGECLVRGGSFNDYPQESQCGAGSPIATTKFSRTASRPFVGIRCCAE